MIWVGGRDEWGSMPLKLTTNRTDCMGVLAMFGGIFDEVR
jgi:hypothetical protein